ncbi:DNA alkylation repair protein [Oxalobacteraceae bacterium A2-2]
MDAGQIVQQLEQLGQAAYKQTLMKHGVLDPVYGVKIEALKDFQKAIKKDYQMALDLYDTGIYDAMYLAGLIADDQAMSKDDLRHWAASARSAPISLYTVPWVAAQGLHGRELALEWIESDRPGIAMAGWATLSGLVALTDDAGLDLAELRALMQRVRGAIATQPAALASAMSGFVAAVGGYVPPLTQAALDISTGIQQLASVPATLEKMQKRGAIGKKRKTVKC